MFAPGSLREVFFGDYGSTYGNEEFILWKRE